MQLQHGIFTFDYTFNVGSHIFYFLRNRILFPVYISSIITEKDFCSGLNIGACCKNGLGR